MRRRWRVENCFRNKQHTKNMNKPIKIEKGIPIAAHPIWGGQTKLLRSMQVGDSFVVPKTKRNGIASCAKSAGIKIVTRSISGAEIRIWRTA